MKSKKYANTLLLTGAGFTKNFGGFLGSEMWSKIFNTPQVSASEKLTEILKEYDNFEDAYYEVMNDSTVTYLYFKGFLS